MVGEKRTIPFDYEGSLYDLRGGEYIYIDDGNIVMKVRKIEKERIKNAVILSGIGSLTDYHVHTVGNRTFPPEGVFMKDDTPEDLLTVTGYVVDGRIHCHITFTDEKRALGGHLEPDTKAFTFAIITIGVLDEPASLKRIDDYTWH